MVFRYKLLVDAEKKLSGEDSGEEQDAESVSDVIVDDKETTTNEEN